jgi:hypothetical protein
MGTQPAVRPVFEVTPSPLLHLECSMKTGETSEAGPLWDSAQAIANRLPSDELPP